MKWNWSNFFLSSARFIFLSIGINAIMGFGVDIPFWNMFFALIGFGVAMEMTVHLVRHERIAEGKEKP